jgi:uncharacterized protein YjiS (DUF1127 family)
MLAAKQNLPARETFFIRRRNVGETLGAQPARVRAKLCMKEITPMTQAIRSWRQTRRFRAIVRELKALSAFELGALGIRETEITHLALEASRV